MATPNTMEDIYPILRSCSFFEGLPEEKYPKLLNRMKAKRKFFAKEETILNIGDHSQLAGIVLHGTVELSFLDENGNQININHIHCGAVFSIELACLQGDLSPMQLKAVSDCDVLFLDFGVLLDANSPLCPFRMRVASNLLRDFAQQNLFLNQRLRIITQKRLRDKIKVYLQCQHIDTDGKIRLPFNRSELADYLYVDRSALSRELSRMCDEGIITCQGQTIQILSSDFLKN